MDETRVPVTCTECESEIRFEQTPYDETDFVVTCDCDYEIDVSDPCNSSSLLEYPSGKWCDLSADIGNRQGDHLRKE